MPTDFTDTKSAVDMEAELMNLLEGANVMDDDEAPIGITYVSDFDSLLTRNRGVIVRLDNGSEYQIAIVQSRAADGDDDESEGDDD